MPRASASVAEVRALPLDQALAVVAGPGRVEDRQGHLSLGEVLDAARLGGGIELLLDLRVGDEVRAELLLEALEDHPQFELARDLAEAAAVHLLRQQFVEVELDVDVGDRGGELLRDARVLGVVGEILLALGAGDLVDVGEHPLEVAVLVEQLGRGFVADAGNAGDVVRGVALQPDQVGDELGRDAVALDHSLAVVDLGVGDAAGGGHHADPVLDQLVDVAVAGDDHHRDVLLAGALRERGDHVVGLPAVHLDVREAEGLREGHQVGPLVAEKVRAGLALGLVGLVGELAARPPGVPADHHGRGVVVDQHLGEHRGEPVDRVGRPPVVRGDRLGQGEERPVGERVAVDQEELAGLLLGLGALGGGLFLGRCGHVSIIGWVPAGSGRGGRKSRNDRRTGLSRTCR